MHAHQVLNMPAPRSSFGGRDASADGARPHVIRRASAGRGMNVDAKAGFGHRVHRVATSRVGVVAVAVNCRGKMQGEVSQ